MNIEIYHYISGAKKAKGLTVIIDVFRAFSVDCYIMSNGAEKIIPVGKLEEAYRLKDENPQYILIGERGEEKPQGFDYGNSPTEIMPVDFTGKTVVQTTGAGTQGIVNATMADEIITGSFVNAQAISNYIRKKNPDTVSLVAMGYAGKYATDEDRFCAEYIKSVLEGDPTDFEEIKEKLKSGSGKRFFVPENRHKSPATDFDYCVNLNAFDLVLKVMSDGENELYLSKVI